jgi:hypothetical protein
MRVWHHWEEWECVKAGMYDSSGNDEMAIQYKEFLMDLELFGKTMESVMRCWPVSCEQFLLNDSINRIAWLGQSSVCFHCGIPRKYRYGFKLLSDRDQLSANNLAHKHLKKWLKRHRYNEPLFNKTNITLKPVHGVHSRVNRFVDTWVMRGYDDGLPEKVPSELMQESLAPSYQQIAIALLKNDMNMTSLGFTAKTSPWYGVLKRHELQHRKKD